MCITNSKINEQNSALSAPIYTDFVLVTTLKPYLSQKIQFFVFVIAVRGFLFLLWFLVSVLSCYTQLFLILNNNYVVRICNDFYNIDYDDFLYK